MEWLDVKNDWRIAHFDTHFQAVGKKVTAFTVEMTDRERRRHGPPEEPKLDTSAGGFLGKYVMLIILVIIERVFWGLTLV